MNNKIFLPAVDTLQQVSKLRLMLLARHCSVAPVSMMQIPAMTAANTPMLLEYAHACRVRCNNLGPAHGNPGECQIAVTAEECQPSRP